MDDGVFWRQAPQGLVAARLAPGGPAARAGVLEGDVLLAVDGEEVLSPARLEAALAGRRPGSRLTYSLLREDERRALDVTVQPLPQGNVSAFYYLSLAGFFSLVVGTVVLLRRPADRTSLHFYAVCVLFFLLYSISYTGKLSTADWVLFWADSLAGALPARGLPPLLPHLPGAAPARAARVGRPRALHAGPRRRRGHRHEPRAVRRRRGARGPVGHRRDDRPGGAALLRRLLHPLLRGPARLLPPHARAHRAPAGEVAAVGHRGGRLPLPRLLRPALRPRPRARARAAARRLRPARAHPALARLRGGQAPPDGRRADLPPRARLRAGGGGDRRARAPDRRRDRRAVGGAAHDASSRS